MADHYGSTSSSLDSYRKRDLGSTLGDYMTRGHGTGQSRHMDGKGIWETRERQCMIRRYVVITTYGMTTSATGEIQKYNFGHSLCKYIMYWDSPDLYLRACWILTKQHMKSYRFQRGGIPQEILALANWAPGPSSH